MNFIAVLPAQRNAKCLYFSEDLFPVRGAEKIVLVTQILPGVPQKKPAVFNVTRCKHELDDE